MTTWSQAQSVAAARMFLRALPVLPPPRPLREDEGAKRWRRRGQMTGAWGSTSSGETASTMTPDSDEVLACLLVLHVTNTRTLCWAYGSAAALVRERGLF